MYPSTVHKDLGRITWNLINGAIRLFPLTYDKFLKINSSKGRSPKTSPSCRPNCFMKKIIGNAFFLYAVGSLDMGFILSFYTHHGVHAMWWPTWLPDKMPRSEGSVLSWWGKSSGFVQLLSRVVFQTNHRRHGVPWNARGNWNTCHVFILTQNICTAVERWN